MVYRHTDVDRHRNLELPDGRNVQTVRASPLRVELERLGVPLNAEWGKDLMLDAYADRIARVAAELLAPGLPVAKHLSQSAMREAVAFLDKQASQKAPPRTPAVKQRSSALVAGHLSDEYKKNAVDHSARGADETPASMAPQRPIATTELR